MSQQVAIPSEQVVADQHLVEDVVVKAKTSFYWAMRLLPAEKRQAMFAVYAFCRVVDDIADGDLPEPAKLRQLQRWREEIDRLYAGDARDPIARALIEPIRRFDLAREDFIAMIDGMETDARGGLIAPAMADLELYCSRVAGAVGLLSVRIFEAPQKGRRELAHALGEGGKQILDCRLCGAGGEHQRGAHAGDADLGALVRQALAEQDDHGEGDRRDDGDQPGVLEEPAGALCSEHQPFISDRSSREMLLRLR
jgi:hypothetical protein